LRHLEEETSMNTPTSLKIGGWSMFVLALLAALGAQSGQKGVQKGVVKGAEAPALSVTDSGGRKHSLMDHLSASGVVLVFWASWAGACSGPNCCPPTTASSKPASSGKLEGKPLLTYVDELRQRPRGKKPEVVIISLDQKKEAAGTVLKLNGVKLPLLFDTDLDAAKAYGVTRLPTVFVIDGRGIVQGVFSGFNSGNEKERKSLEGALGALGR